MLHAVCLILHKLSLKFCHLWIINPLSVMLYQILILTTSCVGHLHHSLVWSLMWFLKVSYHHLNAVMIQIFWNMMLSHWTIFCRILDHSPYTPSQSRTPEPLETLIQHNLTSHSTWIIWNTDPTHPHMPECLNHWKHWSNTASNPRVPQSSEMLIQHSLKSQSTWIIRNTDPTQPHMPEYLNHWKRWSNTASHTRVPESFGTLVQPSRICQSTWFLRI